VILVNIFIALCIGSVSVIALEKAIFSSIVDDRGQE